MFMLKYMKIIYKLKCKIILQLVFCNIIQNNIIITTYILTVINNTVNYISFHLNNTPCFQWFMPPPSQIISNDPIFINQPSSITKRTF